MITALNCKSFFLFHSLHLTLHKVKDSNKRQTVIILQQVQQVQDAKSAGQLAQIEFQVANVLREGNEALKKMHEVCKIKE